MIATQSPAGDKPFNVPLRRGRRGRMERPKKYFHPRPAEAGHPRQRGTSKDKRRKSGDNFKPLSPM